MFSQINTADFVLIVVYSEDSRWLHYVSKVASECNLAQEPSFVGYEIFAENLLPDLVVVVGQTEAFY
jgi:hypothetical protein